MNEEFVFTRERETKNKVVFKKESDKCPISSIYVEKWNSLSGEKQLLLTLKPVE